MLLLQPILIVAAQHNLTRLGPANVADMDLQGAADIDLSDLAPHERLVELGTSKNLQRDLWLAFLAQRERAGYIAPGTVAALSESIVEQEAAVAVAGSLGPPRVVYKETYRVCDLNDDGVDDVIENNYDYTLAQPRVYARNGDTGAIIWNYIGILYYFEQAPFNRQGTPEPFRPENVHPVADVNGNGVCDLLFLGFTFRTRQATAVASVIEVITNLRVLEGSTGAQVWLRTFEGTVALAQVPPGVAGAQVVAGFPTGLISFDSPSGPKYVLKTTDMYYKVVQDPVGIAWVRNFWVAEHVYYANTTTGADFWLRDMPFATDSDTTNLTWLTGIGDLNLDGEQDIVLDQFFVYNPQASIEQDDPLTGQPIFRFGRGVSALALEGGPAGGATIWRNVIRDEGYGRVNTQGEELFNTLIWSNGQVVPDLTGDGTVDVVSLVLTREYLDASTVNGQFRTIITPLNGADGSKLWPSSEIRQQGWGFAAALTLNESAPRLLAVGTIDLPTDAPPESRFPPKDVHITVFDARDGSARWSYAEQFPQDSYLSYHLALDQYIHALAPADVNDDGVLDVATPSQFVAARGANQTLLSSSKHTYSLLDGVDGEELREFEVWGTNGMLVTCGDDLAAFSGHGKQLDFTLLNTSTGAAQWRKTVFVDPSLSSATAGTDLVFLTGKCAAGTDNRTFVTTNIGLNSLKRGFEIMPVFGFLNETDGARDWLLPVPLLEPDYDFLDKTIAKVEDFRPSTAEKVGWSLVPAIPGAGAGVAFALLGRRKGGGVA